MSRQCCSAPPRANTYILHTDKGVAAAPDTGLRPDEQGSTRYQDCQDRCRTAGGVAGRNRRIPRQGARDGAGGVVGPARAAGIRARRHHEPPADLGLGLPAAGPDVPGSRFDRRARRAARLFPRPERMPDVGLGGAAGAARRADGEDRLPRRPYPDRPGAASMCARNPRSAGYRRWSMSATPWKSRSTICARRPANSGCSAFRPSCSRRAATRSPRMPIAKWPGSAAAPMRRFAPGAAQELAELLRAAAAYAAGGMKALTDLSARRSGGAQKLLRQMS